MTPNLSPWNRLRCGLIRSAPFKAFTATFAVLVVATGPLGAEPLKGPDAFKSLSDDKTRSLAAFQEAGKVLTHPRCVNCHPKGDSPLQGEAMEKHQPPVRRGVDNFGAVGMRCTACHMKRNVDYAEVPGHPARTPTRKPGMESRPG